MNRAPVRERERDVVVRAGKRTLAGVFAAPRAARAIVLFADASAPTWRSEETQRIAQTLNGAGVATLRFDLLTLEEEAVDSVTGALRFDIELLATRLVDATDWVLRLPETVPRARFGYFGAGPGAAAAIVAATRRTDAAAIVSAYGRPDLAGSSIERVSAATLLVFGDGDAALDQQNRAVSARAQSTRELEIEVVRGTRALADPHGLQCVSGHVRSWFVRHLLTRPAEPAPTPPETEEAAAR